jgi:hypothetical protein
MFAIIILIDGSLAPKLLHFHDADSLIRSEKSTKPMVYGEPMISILRQLTIIQLISIISRKKKYTT